MDIIKAKLYNDYRVVIARQHGCSYVVFIESEEGEVSKGRVFPFYSKQNDSWKRALSYYNSLKDAIMGN